MPNAVAYLVLFGWPIVVVIFFKTMTPARAVVLSILLAYLLLPVRTQIDPPLLPPFDKFTVPNIAALIACFAFVKMPGRKGVRHFDLVDLVLLTYLLSPFVTALANGDVLRIGRKTLLPMTLYDAFSSTVQIAIYNCVPFWLGRTLLIRQGHFEYLFRAIAVAGVLHSIPVFLEIRLSPQLHTWVYGFFPHVFFQQIRAGGFRPMVFLGHGLVVAFFSMMAAMSAATLARLKARVWNLNFGIVTAYLWLIVVACKSIASMFFASFAVYAILFMKPRLQIRLATAVAIFVLAFPLLRVSDYFPTDALVSIAKSYSSERAESLQFRFLQEVDMLQRARQRPWFGWGAWGRYRTYSTDSGEDVSVTDSRWFITFGQFGALGFFAEFGLFLLPVLLANRVMRAGTTAKDRTLVGAASLLLAIVGIDSLVNDTLSPLIWLIAGALARYVSELQKQQRQWRREQLLLRLEQTLSAKHTPQPAGVNSAP